MQKKSQPENDQTNNIDKVKLKLSPINLPILGISEFLKFNFFKARSTQIADIITPFNLPKKVEFKLHAICKQLGWHDNHVIIDQLNLPLVDQIKYSPLQFKYVYDYAVLHKTQEYRDKLAVPKKVLLTPVNKKKFQLFYSI